MIFEDFVLNFIFIISTIFIFSKFFNSFIGLLISSSLTILLILRILSKQKHLLKEKAKELNKHLENLKKSGLKNLNIREKLNIKNVATNINIFQGDKIILSFLDGKIIIYFIDIIHYKFIELLCIDKILYNVYNSIQLEYENNLILVYGNPGIIILDIQIINVKGKKGNKYKIKQKLNFATFNNKIIKVIELDKNTLISISFDYLLIWYKINDEYIISKKYLDYNKYENLLLLSNLLKLDVNNIVLLKQANSNMTKSTVDFIEITNNAPNEIKLLNVDISLYVNGSNNLLLINRKEKIFLVGCKKGISVISGKYMEIIQFISTGENINYLELFLNRFIIFNSKIQNNDKEYIFYQIEFKNDFENGEKIILKNNSIKKGLNAFKYFKDGIIIISNKEGYLQLWH